MNVSLGLYYLKFVAFKECCLAKILNLDTKAFASLLFHIEEILNSVLIQKWVKVLQSNHCYSVQGSQTRIWLAHILFSAHGGLREEEYLIFKGLQGQIFFVLFSLVVSTYMSFKAN